MTINVTDFVNETKLMLLEEGGVDNWEWYGESVNNYAEMIDDPEADLDSAELLCALENGGVDNWEWYGESLREFGEWRDYVNEYVEANKTLSGVLDYHSWEPEYLKQQQEEQVAAKEAAIKQKIADEEAEKKKKQLPVYDKLVDLIRSMGVKDSDVQDVYSNVAAYKSFWAGLDCEEGKKVFNAAKMKTAKEIEDGKVPPNEFLETARKHYIDKIVNVKKLHLIIDSLKG